MTTKSSLIYDYSLADLTVLLTTWGEPSYRAKQIWEGLYKHIYDTPTQFTNIPKHLLKKLEQEFEWRAFSPVTILESSDRQTIKTLLKLRDGNLIEAVLMKYGDPADYFVDQDTSHLIATKPKGSSQTRHEKKRRTLCISSQVGCGMGCVFCATGQMGFKRNLSSGEILAQVLHYARMLKKVEERVTNVVLMGMGEPFQNYDNVMAAIDRLNASDGFAMGARRFTISTVGLVPAILRFADEQRQINLAISLHQTDDERRSEIMPVNRKWGLDELLDACRYYTQQTNRRLTFEWALIQGVNDSEATATELAGRLKGIHCHVNAIPLNPTGGYSGKATNQQQAANFKKTLELSGIPCTIRMRRGIDISAGCGQLAGSFEF